MCYADDGVRIIINEDDLRRFIIIAKRFDMEFPKNITKCLTTCKETLRCNLEIEGIEPVQESIIRPIPTSTSEPRTEIGKTKQR